MPSLESCCVSCPDRVIGLEACLRADSQSICEDKAPQQDILVGARLEAVCLRATGDMANPHARVCLLLGPKKYGID